MRIRSLHARELALLATARGAAPLVTPEHRPSVTVLVLSLDRLHLTRRCIESLYAHSDYPFDLCIHDDGSQPDVIDYLHQLPSRYGNVEVVLHPERLGCGASRNLAITRLSTDYVFSLDNDIVCHPGWLRETMACAVRHDADFVAPLRLDVLGTVWSFAAELLTTNDGTAIEIARWFHDLPLADVQSWFAAADLPVNYVAGGAGLFSRAAFLDCGGFPAGYRCGIEDMDFCLEMQRRGYQAWATSRAVLTHDDEWQPQTQADVGYARYRYDLVDLRASGVLFKSRWGLEVLPEKYVDSLRRRLQSKLGNGG